MLRPKPLALQAMNQTLNVKSSLFLKWNMAVWAPREFGEISSALNR
jgi:hypothetical protein